MPGRPLLAVVAVVLTAACSSEQAARRIVERADGYAAAGQYDAAILEYRNAIRRQPSAETYCKLGDAYLATAKSEEAYRAFSNAIDADPSVMRAHIEAGRLLLGAKLYDQALLRAEYVTDHDPLNAAGQVLRYRAIGEAALAVGDRLNAEAAFRSATVDAPKSPEAFIALAQFLLATDRAGEAEEMLRKAVAVGPSDELANRAIASFYVSRNQIAAAEPYLKAAAAQPRQRYRSTLALADYYYAAGRYADARAALQQTSGDAAKVRLAAIDYELGAVGDARKQLDRILGKRAPAQGLALNARLLAEERKPDEALQAAQAALALEPDLAAAHYIVGTIAFQQGRLEDAERSFEAVLRVLPNHANARLQLAQVRLATGHAGDAVDLAATAGNSRAARLTLARALAADGQSARARRELEALAVDAATDPEPDIGLGVLDLEAGNLAGAASHAQRALTLAPASEEALELAGRVAIARGDVAAAREHLTRAAEKAPDSFDIHAMLAQTYAQEGDVEKARGVLEPFAKRHPESAQPLTAIGVIYQSAGREADARPWFEQAIAVDSREPVAAATLARMYLGDPSKADAALDLARTAATALADQADVHDTLGQAYFKTGRYRSAVSELERAVAIDGSDASYKRHLDEARRALATENEFSRTR
jgi:cellulose synthase operon protein C